MPIVTYTPTHDPRAPMIVRLGERSTPVWRQGRWEEGEFARYIRANGCGHCCTAMAARLHGVDIDPMEEYLLCRTLWGAPKEDGDPVQHHFTTVAGITKILTHLGIPAEKYGVPDPAAAAAHIAAALDEGKQVIFWSHPRPDFVNPFSKGEHYVMAVGYDARGKIVVANSSEKPWCRSGVHLVEPALIAEALTNGAAPADLTWGEPAHLHKCGGYVVVG